jgi:hypothetical protein
MFLGQVLSADGSCENSVTEAIFNRLLGGLPALSANTGGYCRARTRLWVYMLAYNLSRLLMAQAAADAKTLPRQLSFKHTLQVWVAWSQPQFLMNGQENTTALFTPIARTRAGNRSGRIEPRVIKRRPQAFQR